MTSILNALKEKTALFDNLSKALIPLSIAIVLIWIGCMKFTAYEAGAIEGLVASSPLTGWLYSIFSLQMTSNIIGSIEILTAILIIAGMRFPLLSVIGAAMACATFALTSTFLLSAPVWEASLGGFPALSVVPGQFLLKDIVLLTASLGLFASSLRRL